MLTVQIPDEAEGLAASGGSEPAAGWEPEIAESAEGPS